MQKTREPNERDLRRPKRCAKGQMAKHPKNAPSWSKETQLELTVTV